MAGCETSPFLMLKVFSVGYWPGHLVMHPGEYVLEWPLSGLRQGIDQGADKQRAKLCWTQNTMLQDAPCAGWVEN